MAGTVHEEFHRYVDLFGWGLQLVLAQVVGAEVEGEDVFCGVLFAAGEGVAHVWFRSVGAPMAASAVG